MSPQLSWLVAALVLAVAQIFIAAGAKRKQDGMAWAAGARDNPPTYTGVAARLDRAEKNLFETLWIFSIAVVIGHIAGRETGLTLWGCRLYVIARIGYIPLYALGVKGWRSVAFGVSMAGVVLTLVPLFG